MQRIVTRVHTHITWTLRSGRHCVTHSYAEAPEMGDQHSEVDQRDAAMLNRMVASVNAGLEPLTYQIGAQTWTVQPEVRSFMLRHEEPSPLLHVAIGWTLPNGRDTALPLEYVETDAQQAQRVQVTHGRVIAGLPTNVHHDFYTWAAGYWQRSHARFGLTSPS